MLIFRLGVLTSVLVVICVGCGNSSSSSEDHDVLYQVSTIDSLKQGDFEGTVSFGDLDDHGDFGLGTFDGLNGELIMLDGDSYQVRADGVAYKVPDDATTPFSAVTDFGSDLSASFDAPLSCDELYKQLDGLLPDPTTPYAIRISGNFSKITTRSENEQKPPYPTLADALENQIEFDLEDTSGTMVGFHLPESFDGVNTPGYHFHYINDDRTAGGHVLDCEATNVDIGIDVTDGWFIELQSKS